jgi:hypothetical protein
MWFFTQKICIEKELGYTIHIFLSILPMTTDQKLDHILATLMNITAFVEKQEAFNTKQESFNTRQESFNTRQEWTNSRFEVSLDGIRRDLAELRHDEEIQHNVTHRLIGQAFQHISDLQSKQPWQA